MKEYYLRLIELIRRMDHKGAMLNQISIYWRDSSIITIELESKDSIEKQLDTHGRFDLNPLLTATYMGIRLMYVERAQPWLSYSIKLSLDQVPHCCGACVVSGFYNKDVYAEDGKTKLTSDQVADIYMQLHNLLLAVTVNGPKNHQYVSVYLKEDQGAAAIALKAVGYKQIDLFFNSNSGNRINLYVRKKSEITPPEIHYIENAALR